MNIKRIPQLSSEIMGKHLGSRRAIPSRCVAVQFPYSLTLKTSGLIEEAKPKAADLSGTLSGPSMATPGENAAVRPV